MNGVQPDTGNVRIISLVVLGVLSLNLRASTYFSHSGDQVWCRFDVFQRRVKTGTPYVIMSLKGLIYKENQLTKSVQYKNRR